MTHSIAVTQQHAQAASGLGLRRPAHLHEAS